MNRMYTEYLKLKFRAKRRVKRWRKGTRSDSLAGNVNQVIIAGGDDDVAEFLWTHLEAAHFVEVPFLLVYGLLLLYITFASYIVSKIENWPLADGFYYIMMSVLTVGFGDKPHETAILQDPLSWLKAVQQKRIEAMKREAMRKLFETVTALHHIRFTTMQRLIEQTVAKKEDSMDGLDLPNEIIEPPTGIYAFNATADSVCLRWKAPLREPEGKRFWYTLTYKTRNPHWIFGRNQATIVDFITGENYEVKGLKTFTLYQFSLVVTTRYGSSKPANCQEYTEPCTVPQCVAVEAISSETMTLSWKAPKKNNGPERYVILYSQEPAPQFKYWNRYKCGAAARFTIPDLTPDTRYIACVSAEHNFGLAAMSKSIRFRTKLWWHEEADSSLLAPLVIAQKRLSIISSISNSSALR
ncbi:hypothetical protein PFISCL1PPCAC_158 [Pristionchus fissidentatus]|uniref:Fibronectin type-III domain-containing protein n=1 Tax=Pristionchus fissidentatus TaxID=1538716 RepID=A0AAV5UP01_9BILA|nr:hypothetical protein PFISCL1PPCAC_158 [Pristionchus fissidentatus]